MAKLNHSIWLLILLTAFAPFLQNVVSASAPNSFAYDELNQAKIAYDASSLSAFNYDPAAVPITDDEASATVEANSPFGKSAGFLAAKTPRQILDELPTGKQSHVRTVKTETDLKSLHDQLTAGGTPQPPGSYPGTVTKLSDGTIVRMRGASKSGGSTIDITLPDGRLEKIHIE